MENKVGRPVLKAVNLNKIYDNGQVRTHAVKDATFTINEGEFIIILGPSGSGKSTLMNLIGGMDSVTSGELYYHDTPVHTFSKKDMAKYRRNAIGFVFQFYNLLPSLNCFENIALTAQLSKKSLDVSEIIEKVGLKGWEKHFPSQLSGGQQQRVAVARAIVKAPEILLCDEPTGALDTETSIQVLELLKSINRDLKKTVIVISHDTELLAFADRFFEIRDGILQERAMHDVV